MKYLLLVYLLLSMHDSFSQPNVDGEAYPLIAFAGGKSLSQSASVKTITSLLKKENWDSIKTFMHSTDPSLKYLSIKSCSYQSQKGLMVFNTQEQATIEVAKASSEKIKFMKGCTTQEVYTLQELFQNNTLEINKDLLHWIKEIKK